MDDSAAGRVRLARPDSRELVGLVDRRVTVAVAVPVTITVTVTTYGVRLRMRWRTFEPLERTYAGTPHVASRTSRGSGVC